MAQTQNKQNNNFTKNITIEILTPLIAPSLSPNKFMKRLQIEDLKKYYPPEAHELVEHIDRAFERDIQGNILLSSAMITGALRNQYPNYSTITVSGIILFSKEYVRVATKKVANSLVNYEYLVPGAKTQATLIFSQEIKLPILIRLGAKKNKGYGLTKLSES